MNIIEPKTLKLGDTIAVIAPAGGFDRDKFLKGVSYLENLGFKVKYSENIFKSNKYLAGDDKTKIKEIESYFRDEEVKGIMCARGGYGSIRLIKDIDYSVIQNNPKVFCGYSDITALQLMTFKKTGLITYSAPMVISDFAQDEVSQFTVNSFMDTVVKCKEPQIKGEKIHNGEASAPLWGGNLSTIVSLCGQDFIPDEDFIFFCEDLGEPVYKIDKMLRQLINIDCFKKHVKGLIFGEFLDIDNKEWLDELILETAEELNVPTLKNAQITHSKDKLTIPIGKEYNLC